jgi:hypothetical protein
MSIPFENKKFRINPIEIAVFAVVGLIFVKSGYNLLYAKSGYEATALTEAAQDPVHDPIHDSLRARDRDPAQVQASQSTFSEIKIGCDPSVVTPSTNSAKIRLIGALCKPAEMVQAPKQEDTETSENAPAVQALPVAVPTVTEEAAENVKRISVVNTSARVAATVFPDYSNQRFSTDYISLTQGKNLIYVQYEFKDGKTLGQEFSVTKN